MLAKLIAIIPISELEKAGARRKSKCVDEVWIQNQVLNLTKIVADPGADPGAD